MKAQLGTCRDCRHPCSPMTNICPPCLDHLHQGSSAYTTPRAVLGFIIRENPHARSMYRREFIHA
jgi:hypothetical protein